MNVNKKLLFVFAIAAMLLLTGCTSPPASETKTKEKMPEIKTEQPKMEDKISGETMEEKPVEAKVEEDNYNDDLGEAQDDLDVVGDLNLLEAIEEN